METKAELMAWVAAHTRPFQPRQIGCACGCESRLPWVDDPECVRHWPTPPDPLCEACGTVLDPDGTCYPCSSRLF
jgi:hypothetical protein